MNIIEKIEELKEFDTQYQNIKGVRVKQLTNNDLKLATLIIRQERNNQSQRIATSNYYKRKRSQLERLKQNNTEEYNEIIKQNKEDQREKYRKKKLEMSSTEKAYKTAQKQLKKLEKQRLEAINTGRPDEQLLKQIQSIKQDLIRFENSRYGTGDLLKKSMKSLFNISFDIKSISNE